MKLWLISQDENSGYDTYDSAVVAAETEGDARRTSPNPYRVADEGGNWRFRYAGGSLGPPERHDAWVSWERVSVKLIGEASPGMEAGVICASFNAG